MEEIPHLPNKFESSTGQPPDPEKIGDLLLRYELPRRSQTPESADRQNPKDLISRDKLRSKLRRYKEQKSVPQSPLTPESSTAPELSEAQFERHEVMQNETDEPATLASNPEAPHISGPTIPVSSSPVPLSPQQQYYSPPVLPNLAAQQLKVAGNQPAPAYKKFLLFGLLAGVIAGTILIIAYFK